VSTVIEYTLANSIEDMDNAASEPRYPITEKKWLAMKDKKTDLWISRIIPRHQRLTESVVTIVENLLKEEKVDYLTVVGRTKSRQSIEEKIERKGYRTPETELTDISGIRIILYLESDLHVASKIIEGAFEVDASHSLDKDELMSINQLGYRSLHFVCDLGERRAKLPEFAGFFGLKFEFQLRTVLQHAWAELAHDRNYKFSGSLPKDLERQLYLYAGLLEIADRGFDELSKSMDRYIESIDELSSDDDIEFEINSLSLQKFMELWQKDNGLTLEEVDNKKVEDLVKELKQFQIRTLEQLQGIIPAGYSDAMRGNGGSEEELHNILGTVRNWMIITDWRRFFDTVKFSWCLDDDDEDSALLSQYMSPEECDEMYKHFAFDSELKERPMSPEEAEKYKWLFARKRRVDAD